MSTFEPWEYRPDAAPRQETDLVGCRVQATDGEVGIVVDVIHAPRHKALVIDTGDWVVGQRILLPVGVVAGIDQARRMIAVDRSVAEIKAAPPYEPALGEAPQRLNELADYYCGLYGGDDQHYPSPEGPAEFADPGVVGSDDALGNDLDAGRRPGSQSLD
ncbi:PRC-barrel domain-containing protein [Kribbella sp. CA-253562]|uniref:PRC-barrel domain-containing protein n=1 Tax=Kribbella sp. CA-253562 TaxID=3239942 RepID=UPI003D94989A